MADDGQQVIVATLWDLISVKRIVVSARSTQWLGQMSDTTLQQLSQHHVQGKREPVTRSEVQTDTQLFSTESQKWDGLGVRVGGCPKKGTREVEKKLLPSILVPCAVVCLPWMLTAFAEEFSN